MIRHLVVRSAALATALAAACASLGAQAADFSQSGSLVFNTDVAQVAFRLDSAALDVSVWTDSWLAGLNFDPIAAVWAKVGSSYILLGEVDDDDTVGAGQGAFDAGLRFASLAAGDYLVTIAAAPNTATGTALSAGFAFDGSAPIALADWMQPSADPNFPDQQGGVWRVNLSNVSSVSAVPEPTSWALMAAGLLITGAITRRRNRASR